MSDLILYCLPKRVCLGYGHFKHDGKQIIHAGIEDQAQPVPNFITHTVTIDTTKQNNNLDRNLNILCSCTQKLTARFQINTYNTRYQVFAYPTTQDIKCLSILQLKISSVCLSYNTRYQVSVCRATQDIKCLSILQLTILSVCLPYNSRYQVFVYPPTQVIKCLSILPHKISSVCLSYNSRYQVLVYPTTQGIKCLSILQDIKVLSNLQHKISRFCLSII